MTENCNIFRNSSGGIEFVEAPNGRKSKLFDGLAEKLQDKEEALQTWFVSRTKGFKTNILKPLQNKLKELNNAGVTSPIVMNGVVLNFGSRVNPFTLEDTGEVELKLVNTDPKFRGKGLAKKAISRFLDYTDTIQKPTYLTISPRDASTTEAGLVKLYESFGFEMEPTGFEMVRPVGNRRLTNLVEGLDINGEPSMSVLLNYVDNLSENLTIDELNEDNVAQEESAYFKDTMLSLPVKSTQELLEKVEQAFFSKGYFHPTRQSLEDSELYSNEEIIDILSTEELQERIRTFAYRLKQFQGEALNDIYFNDTFAIIEDGTKNDIGKFKITNPYIMEKQAIDVLSEAKNREEFEDILAEDERVSALTDIYLETKNTKEDLYDKIKDFSKVNSVDLYEGRLELRLSNTKMLFNKVLTVPENDLLGQKIDYLLSLDDRVFEANPQAVLDLVGIIGNNLLDIGMDTTDIVNISSRKNPAQIKEFFIAISDLFKNETVEDLNNLAEVYDEYFNVNIDPKFKSVKLNRNVSDNNNISFKTTVSDVEVFSEQGLIPVGEGVYKRVNKEGSLETLYEKVYNNIIADMYSGILPQEAFSPTALDEDGTFNLSKLMDPSNKDSLKTDIENYVKTQAQTIFIGDSNIDMDTLEKYVLMFNFFNKSSDLNKFNKVPQVINELSIYNSEIANLEYLQTEFEADFHKKIIKEKSKTSIAYSEFYKNFEVNNTGIELINNDPITLNTMDKYLPSNQDLINYFNVNKKRTPLQLNREAVEIPTEVFYRNYYTNFPNALQALNEDYTRLSDNTLLASTKEDFVRTSEGVYELVKQIGNKGVYVKLDYVPSDFKIFNRELAPPTIDVDITEFTAIDTNIESTTEIKNLYSKAEKNQIDEKHDNC